VGAVTRAALAAAAAGALSRACVVRIVQPGPDERHRLVAHYAGPDLGVIAARRRLPSR
jgi:hypothetical protein